MYHHYGTQGRTHRLFHYPQSLLLFAGIIAIFIITFQHILYFAGLSISSLPLDSNTSTMSVVSLEDYEAVVKEFYDKPITISLLPPGNMDKVSITLSKSELGFKIQPEKIKKDAEKYDYRKSLVPFGSLFFSESVELDSYIELDESILRAFTNQLDQKHSTAPINANISFPLGDQVPTITPALSGYKYGSDRIYDAIRSAVYGRFESIEISPAEVSPELDEEFLMNNQDSLYTILTKTVTFTDGENSIPLKGTNELLATIQPDTGGKLTFKTEAIAEYLEKWVFPTFSREALPAITMQESGRSYAAQSGKKVKTNEITTEYKNALLSKDTTAAIHVETEVIQPPPSQVTTQGSVLHLKIVTAELGSKYNAAIFVDFLDDDSVEEIGYNVHQSRVAASTYKLLVAYAVAKNIDAGTLAWDTPSLNRTTRTCLESMLVFSTNHCAENWVKNQYGYAYMNELASELGLVNTCFQCADFAQASVYDQVKLLTSFYQAKGLSAESSSVIVDMLKRQKYREGIPSVTKLETMNKIGWVPGHYNDSAIIQTSKGPMGISIYTTSSSWSQIREITKQVLTAIGN